MIALLLLFATQSPDPARVLQHSPLPPLAPDPTNAVADDPRAAQLGQYLFFDPGLSAGGRFACASCHVPDKALSDGKPHFEGLGQGQRNTPTLWNVAYQRWFFWDGRADTLWSQALVPIENPLEMGTSAAEAVAHLARSKELRSAYEALFGPLPEPHVLAQQGEALERAFTNVGKCLEAYERKLVSRSAPFDRYAAALRAGDEAGQKAYPEAARRGLALFDGRAGCRSCHPGPFFSDGEFHDIGVPRRGAAPDPARRAGIEKLLASARRADGPFSDARTGEKAGELKALVVSSAAWGAYRTPSLRNVARTAPYMDRGQFASLREVLEFYSERKDAEPAGHHGEQVLAPLHFAPREIDDLLAFLETLSDDESDPALLAQPSAPH
jgi:cytochrome c peroxidase